MKGCRLSYGQGDLQLGASGKSLREAMNFEIAGIANDRNHEGAITLGRCEHNLTCVGIVEREKL